MRLYYNNTTQRTFSAPGFRVYPKNFGSTSSVEYTSPRFSRHNNYFHSFVEALVRRGYRRDHDIRGAAYDWRKAPDDNPEFESNLVRLIEETSEANGGNPVAIVCHSMGCLHTYHFLRHRDKNWRSVYIKALIITATPWDGNFKYLYSYIGSDDDFMARVWSGLRPMERTLSSLTILLPHFRSYSNETLIETETRNYTVNDYEDIFRLLRNDQAYEMWRDNHHMFQDWDHPEVDIYCFGGIGIPTPEKVAYSSGQSFPGSRGRLFYGDGDGILSRKSMEACLRWKQGSESRGFRFLFKAFDRMSHMSILRHHYPVSTIIDTILSL
jgi:lysophospholipase-3